MPCQSYHLFFFKEQFTEKMKIVLYSKPVLSFFNKQIVAAARFHKIKVHGGKAFDHQKNKT